MGTRGLRSRCKVKLELAIVNGTISGHIYMTLSLPAQCSNVFAQVHRDFFLALYKNISMQPKFIDATCKG